MLQFFSKTRCIEIQKYHHGIWLILSSYKSSTAEYLNKLWWEVWEVVRGVAQLSNLLGPPTWADVGGVGEGLLCKEGAWGKERGRMRPGDPRLYFPH